MEEHGDASAGQRGATARAEADAPGRSPGYWPAAAVLAVPALLPFARLVELPLLLMLVVGCRDLFGRRAEALAAPSFRLFLALFACYWIPGVLSAIDAVDPGKAWSWVAAQLRFVPVAAFVALRLDARQGRLVLLGTAALVGFWTVDVLLQAALGRNLLGMPLSPERLNGIFGPTNIKLGLVLAAFAALALEPLRRRHPAAVLAAWLVLLTALLLIGTRAALIMFAVVTVAHAFLFARGRAGRLLQATLALGLAGSMLAVGTWYGSDTVRNRVETSLGALDGSGGHDDVAVSLRLNIWRTALAMGAAHPFNGVGVRGFRHAYEPYAAPDDPLAVPGFTATHAHQLLLEVAAETGLIGLAGLGLALVLAARAWARAPPDRRRAALPFALCLGAMLFPVNTHLAFYSTFWSIVFWWLGILFCVHVAGGATPASAER